MPIHKSDLLESLRPGRTMDATPERQNSRMLMSAGGFLTLIAISCAALGLWRMGVDLDWAGDFVFHNGLLSHWQVWIGAAAGIQYTSLRLTRYVETCAQAQSEPRTSVGVLKPADAV